MPRMPTLGRSTVRFASACPERIKPKPAETLEVCVEGAECRAVLDRERCKMGVRGEITGSLGAHQESAKNRKVTTGRMQNARSLVREPRLNHRDRIFHREGFWENSAASRETNKSKESHPREADAFRFIEG